MSIRRKIRGKRRRKEGENERETRSSPRGKGP